MLFLIIYLFLIFLTFIFALFSFFFSVSMLYSNLKGAPYVPSSKNEVMKILKYLKPKKNSLIIELGSGDGRFLRLASKNYETKGIGVEINPFIILYARFLNYLFKTKNVSFVKSSLYDYPLGKADYIYLFLYPKLLDNLTKILDKQCKKTCIIISHGFKIPRWDERIYHTIESKPFYTYFYRLSPLDNK